MLKTNKPYSNDKISESLLAAKEKYEQVMGSGGTPAFSAAVYNKLTLFLPLYIDKISSETFSLSDQINYTTLKTDTLKKLRMFIIHFIKTFNNAIARGVLKPSERRFYKLDVNSRRVPSLLKEASVCIVAENLIAGEAERISRGLQPVVFPDISEIQLLYNNYKLLFDQQNARIELHDKEQEELEALKKQALDILNDVWAEVQFTYRKESRTSARQNCRLYGINYKSVSSAKKKEKVLEE